MVWEWGRKNTGKLLSYNLVPSSITSIFDAKLSLSEDNASLSQQYPDGSMAFCQDSCLFQSTSVYDRMDAVSSWTRSVTLADMPGLTLMAPGNFPKVAMFQEFLGKPILQSRTGMTGPSSQGWVEAMSRGDVKPPWVQQVSLYVSIPRSALLYALVPAWESTSVIVQLN